MRKTRTITTTTAKPPQTEEEWEGWLFRFVRGYPAALHDDLMQEARLGLLRARELYTPREAAFTSFAHHHVKGAVRHYMRDKASTIRVAAYAYEAGVRVLCHSNLNQIGEDDFADVYEQAESLEAATLSLENNVVLSLQVRNALAPLSPRQREAVWMAAVEGRSFSEIARVWGISTSYAHHLYKRGVRRMTGLLEREGFHASVEGLTGPKAMQVRTVNK